VSAQKRQSDKRTYPSPAVRLSWVSDFFHEISWRHETCFVRGFVSTTYFKMKETTSK
jgi:hypothetical protein